MMERIGLPTNFRIRLQDALREAATNPNWPLGFSVPMPFGMTMKKTLMKTCFQTC